MHGSQQSVSTLLGLTPFLSWVVYECIQSDLTYPHTSVLDELVDKVRELNK